MTSARAAATNRSMTSLLLTLNALICVALIILILLQRSDPSSGGMFGGAGGGGNQPVVRNPLAKPTAVLAGLFLVFSLALAYLNKGAGHGDSVMTGEIAAPKNVGEAAVSGTESPEGALPGPSLLEGNAAGVAVAGSATMALPAELQDATGVSATGQ